MPRYVHLAPGSESPSSRSGSQEAMFHRQGWGHRERLRRAEALAYQTKEGRKREEERCQGDTLSGSDWNLVFFFNRSLT